LKWLSRFRGILEARIYFGKTPKERGLQWYEYAVVVWPNCDSETKLIFPDLSTHCHFVRVTNLAAFNQHTPVLSLKTTEGNLHLIAALMNASSSLFWFKQACFSKRESEEGATDTYFEFAGGKVQQLPVPEIVVEAIRGSQNKLANLLKTLSQECWVRGHQMASLSMKKLFEKQGEAYFDWNSTLPGYSAPNTLLRQPFDTADDLKNVFINTCTIREKLRNEMIALQEEMDWLVYAAYGLIEPDAPALSHIASPESISREQRPYVLWQRANEDLSAALALIPQDWSEERKKLWNARLNIINENEHIRRIEQPVYKRRWDEQWKVGNRWQCGQDAYNAELLDAFDWWLSEKAEWWLEKKANGGPISLAEWAAAMWQDERVHAAWEGVRKIFELSAEKEAFLPYFSALIKEQTVPDNIPVAVPWDEITVPVPASAKRIRGKLNVPRERFHVNEDSKYTWAGQK
jgi:hypothetical protein